MERIYNEAKTGRRGFKSNGRFTRTLVIYAVSHILSVYTCKAL